jgi:hypothetical protein
MALLLWLYETGHYAVILPFVGSIFFRFLIAGVIAAVTFSAPALRELTLRAGFQSDLLFVLLVSIMTSLGIFIYYHYVNQIYDLQDVAKRFDLAGEDAQAWVVVLIGNDLMNLLALPCVLWIVLQLFGLFTVPVKYLLPRVSAARAQHARQLGDPVSTHF